MAGWQGAWQGWNDRRVFGKVPAVIPHKLALTLGFALAAFTAGVARGARGGAAVVRRLHAPRTSSRTSSRSGGRTSAAICSLPTDEAVAPEGAQWDAPVGVILDTPAGSLTYDLGAVRPVSSFLRPGRRQRHLQDLRRRGEQARGVQAAGRGRQRRRHAGARAPHAHGHHRRDAGPLPAGRRAGRRRRLLDRRVPGLLPRADAVPAQADHQQRAAGRWSCSRGSGSSPGGRTTPARAFEMALALAALALVGWGLWLTKQGRDDFKRRLRDRLLMVLGVLSFCALLELRQLPLRELRPHVGHVPLLRRLEVLQRAVVRPPLRVRGRRRLRGAGAAPPGRAAQDHEPAHQHDGGDAGDPGAPRALQGPLHARALGRLQARRRLLPQPPRRQALGGGADRPRLQRHAGLEHRRHDAGQPVADQRRPDQLPHPHRSVLHLRDHAS